MYNTLSNIYFASFKQLTFHLLKNNNNKMANLCAVLASRYFLRMQQKEEWKHSHCNKTDIDLH